MNLNMIDSTRNHQLDGLRGYAAVAVAVFHTILGMDETLILRIVYGELSKLPDAYSWFAKIILKLFSGETAVFIFFVLSGTVLFQSLMHARRPFLSEAVGFCDQASGPDLPSTNRLPCHHGLLFSRNGPLCQLLRLCYQCRAVCFSDQWRDLDT